MAHKVFTLPLLLIVGLTVFISSRTNKRSKVVQASAEVPRLEQSTVATAVADPFDTAMSGNNLSIEDVLKQLELIPKSNRTARIDILSNAATRIQVVSLGNLADELRLICNDTEMSAVCSILTSRFISHPEHLKNWIYTLPSDSNYAGLITAAGAALEGLSNEGIVELVSNLPNAANKNMLLDGLVNRLTFSRDFNGSVELLDKLGYSSAAVGWEVLIRNEFQKNGVSELSRHFLESPKPKWTNVTQVSDLFGRMIVTENKKMAYSLVAANEEKNPELSASIARAVVDDAYYTDPAAASTWVNSLSNLKVRDAAAQALSLQLLNTTPDDSFRWALSIRDKTQSTRIIDKIIEKWARQFPEQTIGWKAELAKKLHEE